MRLGRWRIAAAIAVLSASACAAPLPSAPPSATPAPPAAPISSAASPKAAAQPSPGQPAAPSAGLTAAWTSVTQTKPILGGELFGGDGNQYIMAATAYGDGFVAVGEDCCGTVDTVTGAVWTTPDGSSWTRIEPKAVFGEAEIDQVAASGHRLVAIGTSRPDSQPGTSQTLVWLSDDGIAWRRGDAAGQAFTAWFRPEGIAGGPAGFIAWGESPARVPQVAVSADGESWTDVGFASSYPRTVVGGITPWRGGWVAVGSQTVKQPAGIGASTPGPARAWYSADGAHWSPAAADGLALGRALAGADGLLAMGAGSECGACVGPQALWHSDDGRAWRSLGPDRYMNLNYAADEVHIARLGIDVNAPAGRDEALDVSPDGVHWTSLEKGMAGEQHLGVAVGSKGVLLLEPVDKGGATDQVDAGVWYLPAQ